MDRQMEKTDLTRDKIRELIKDLDSGTMLILEMPGPDDSDDTNEHPKM